jgi:hypothetical protein
VCWTLQLLADRLVALTRLESLSYEAVPPGAKKNDLKPWQRQKGCIPTVIGARFVWCMEDILDLYTEPYRKSAVKRRPKGLGMVAREATTRIRRKILFFSLKGARIKMLAALRKQPPTLQPDRG